MKAYYKNHLITIYHGDCLKVLKRLEECSIDTCITDPPYGIGFMEKEWDSDIAFNPSTWKAIYRVLKPGSFMLVFSGSRTYHRVATAIEEAGFVIYPMLAWIYGSGFPKGNDLPRELDKRMGVESEVVGYETRYNEATGIVNVGQGERKLTVRKITRPASELGKKWDGWKYGLQILRPSLEPICMAQKPPEGTIPDNVIKWGVGAVNVEGCRFGEDRWPTNIMHDGSVEVEKCFGENIKYFPGFRAVYCPKPTRKEKERGLEAAEPSLFGISGGARKAIEKGLDKYQEGHGVGLNKVQKVRNTHPTVKPIRLMEYLIKLVTPPGGTVLDPFMGSGTTLMAAMKLGIKCVGIEIEEEYCRIAKNRLFVSSRLMGFIMGNK